MTMTHRSHARRIAAAACAAALVATLAACSTPAAPAAGVDVPGVTEDTVTIGTHTPLTGPAAAGYAGISAAATAYFDYLNEKGGIHGRSIEYIVKDDGYNPSNTQTVVRELVQEDKVFAIVNGLGTPTHLSVLEFLNQNKVPDLFVASGASDWNQPDKYPYTFSFNASYVVEGAALAQYATDEHPGKKVCLFGQDDDFGNEFIEGAQQVVGADGLAAVERYAVSNPDVSAQISALRTAGCEIVMLATIPGFSALAIGTAAQLGWSPMWFATSVGADYVTLSGLLKDAAPQLLDGFVSANYMPGISSDWVELFSTINDEYNDGAVFDGNAIYGMSMAYLFSEALEAAGENPTRESLLEALTSGDLTGNGIVPLAFAKDSHEAYPAAGIQVVHDGVQDYVGATYHVTDDGVEAIDPAFPPAVNKGIPGN